MRYVRIIVLTAAMAQLSGCLSLKAYDGATRDRGAVATVIGDYKVRAGAPLSLLLREIDDTPVDVRYSSVKVLPGPHRVLVDCKVQGGAGSSRHAIEAELEAGVRYRIIADTTAGNRECDHVRLDALD